MSPLLVEAFFFGAKPYLIRIVAFAQSRIIWGVVTVYMMSK